MAVTHNGKSVIEIASQIRKELGLPFFSYGLTFSPAQWAQKMGKTMSEFLAINEQDRIDFMATSIVSDAMEIISSHRDKIVSAKTDMKVDPDELKQFMSDLERSGKNLGR